MFHNPIAPKEGVKKAPSRSPWDFTAPAYDERSSCFMSAGTNYGVGYNNPIGHDSGAPKQHVPTLPMESKSSELPH